jgi:hypothetical protein
VGPFAVDSREGVSCAAGTRPTRTGRLTARGDTVSLQRLVAAKPDLFIDFGSVTGTYVALADRAFLCRAAAGSALDRLEVVDASPLCGEHPLDAGTGSVASTLPYSDFGL